MGLAGFARASGGSTPGRLRGGGARAAWASTLTLARCLPLVVVVLALTPSVAIVGRELLVGSYPVGAAMLIALALVVTVLRSPLAAIWRVAFFSLRWFSDARAAGLCMLAEIDVDKDHDPDDNTLEVAPPLSKLKVGPGTRTYDVRPLPGQSLKLYEDACPTLKIRWRAHDVTAKALVGSRLNRGRIRITATLGDPLANVIESRPPRAPAPPVNVVGRSAPTIRIAGLTRARGPLNLSLGAHTLIVGATGGGKSGGLRQVIVALARRPDTQLVLLDPKHVEFGRWKTRPMIVAKEPDDIEEALRWVVELMDARYRLMVERDRDTWTDDLGPWVAVVADEIADIFEWRKTTADESLELLARKARAAGISLVLATQRASANIVPSSLRGNLAQRIVFRTDNADATEFGLPGKAKDYPAHEFAADDPGRCYWMGVDGMPVEARVAWLAGEHVPSIDARHARHRLDPDELLPRRARPGPVADDDLPELTLLDLDDLERRAAATPPDVPVESEIDADDLERSVDEPVDLYEILGTGGHTVPQLVEATGLPEADVRRILAELEARGYVKKGGDHRWRRRPQSADA